MAIKLDMGAAWNDAVAMIKANREVITVMAGVFFFVPGLAAAFMMGEPEIAETATPEEMIAGLQAFFTDNALTIVVLSLCQAVGFIAMLALLNDTAKPTVGEAIKTGAIGLLSYLAINVMFSLAVALILTLAVGVPTALGGAAIGALLAIVAIPVIAYLVVKLSLATAIIAIEKVLSPIAVIRRSWELTKGNSARLLIFFVLLVVVYMVVSLLIGVIIGIPLALLGEGGVLDFLVGFFDALIGAVATSIFACVIAATYRQLSGGTGPAIVKTFE